MRIFVYSMREYDELPFFEKYAKEYDVEFGYTTEMPSPENYELAKGYDALSILTTPTPAEMIDIMKDYGIKIISTRTIGFAALDVIERELGIYYNDFSGKIIPDSNMAYLRSMHNVWFSPHTAFYSEVAVANMVENSIIGIKAYMNGEDHRFIIK